MAKVDFDVELVHKQYNAIKLGMKSPNNKQGL